MYINKLKKEKNGMYKIEFDSFSLTLHEDLILKYDLLLTKTVDVEQLDLLREENKKYEVYQITLKLLKTKLRTKKELTDFLLKKAYDPVLIEESLLLLEKQGYLNEEFYTPSFVHDRLLLSKDGPLKIRKDLEDRGVSLLVIEKALQEFSLELERERINKILQKQSKLNRNKGTSVFKKKMQYDLLRLGYHDHAILTELAYFSVDDSSLAKKEYEKIKTKLEGKYTGKELEYKIKQKMYQKGFSYESYED